MLEVSFAAVTTAAVGVLLWMIFRGHSIRGWRLYVLLATIALMAADALVHVVSDYGVIEETRWLAQLVYASNLLVLLALMFRWLRPDRKRATQARAS